MNDLSGKPELKLSGYAWNPYNLYRTGPSGAVVHNTGTEARIATDTSIKVVFCGRKHKTCSSVTSCSYNQAQTRSECIELIAVHLSTIRFNSRRRRVWKYSILRLALQDKSIIHHNVSCLYSQHAWWLRKISRGTGLSVWRSPQFENHQFLTRKNSNITRRDTWAQNQHAVSTKVANQSHELFLRLPNFTALVWNQAFW